MHSLARITSKGGWNSVTFVPLRKMSMWIHNTTHITQYHHPHTHTHTHTYNITWYNITYHSNSCATSFVSGFLLLAAFSFRIWTCGSLSVKIVSAPAHTHKQYTYYRKYIHTYICAQVKHTWTHNTAWDQWSVVKCNMLPRDALEHSSMMFAHAIKHDYNITVVPNKAMRIPTMPVPPPNSMARLFFQ